jgi:hypothetical protein
MSVGKAELLTIIYLLIIEGEVLTVFMLYRGYGPAGQRVEDNTRIRLPLAAPRGIHTLN